MCLSSPKRAVGIRGISDIASGGIFLCLFITKTCILQALKYLPREKIQLATKFGVVRNSSDIKNPAINGSPEYIRACCDASLKRLDLEYIDLYYQHRVDTSVPIEETVCSFPFFHHGIVQTNCLHYLISNPITLSWQMGELKKLVEEGKVKYIGLSEASPDTIKRAHAVHPISAVQMEWSLWSRDIEEEIIPLCRYPYQWDFHFKLIIYNGHFL